MNHSGWYGLLRVLPAMEHWQKGDLALARKIVSQEAQKLDTSDDHKIGPRPAIAMFYMTLGQLDAAEEVVPDPPWLRSILVSCPVVPCAAGPGKPREEPASRFRTERKGLR